LLDRFWLSNGNKCLYVEIIICPAASPAAAQSISARSPLPSREPVRLLSCLTSATDSNMQPKGRPFGRPFLYVAVSFSTLSGQRLVAFWIGEDMGAFLFRPFFSKFQRRAIVMLAEKMNEPDGVGIADPFCDVAYGK